MRAGKTRAREPGILAIVTAEVLGTFALTLVDCGGGTIASLTGQISYTARALAPGLLVMAVIYGFGDVSGAHINPAVTFAFAARGVFPWRRVWWYWLAQLAGATGAAALLDLLYGNAVRYGATIPHYSVLASFSMEIVLTCLLVTIILGTSNRHKIVGPEAAIAVGGVIAVCNLFAKPISGASMNPARSFGPAVFTSGLGSLWIYILGPLVGAGLAVLISWQLHGYRRAGEQRAAQGDGAEK